MKPCSEKVFLIQPKEYCLAGVHTNRGVGSFLKCTFSKEGGKCIGQNCKLRLITSFPCSQLHAVVTNQLAVTLLLVLHLAVFSYVLCF